MARKSPKKLISPVSNLSWAPETEIIGLGLELVPQGTVSIYPQYTIALHAWFLDQVRSTNPTLSAYLHDGESEKPFTISALDGEIVSTGREVQLSANAIYRWYVTALSKPVVEWMEQWVQNLPTIINLRNANLLIRRCFISHTPTTYANLFTNSPQKTLSLHFLSPTSFRRKGHHFPLPVPVNLFHSYLRRWNDFSGNPVDQDSFLNWVDESVLILRHQIASAKVLAGKKGAVTGFTGAIELGLTQEAAAEPLFHNLFYALVKLAPYCGTGHKTTFGLGQTRSGWGASTAVDIPDVESLLAKRIEELTEIFKTQRKRMGGDRAQEIALKWATILARREMGESLQVIAQDLEMPYETVKTYAKLSRKALKSE